MYISDSSKKQIYIKDHRGFEIYAFNFRLKQEILALDENDREYYARRDGNEVYPIHVGFGEHLRQVNTEGDQFYVRDKYNSERYPLNYYRKEYLAQKTINGKLTFYYATFADSEMFYPIEDNGKEWIHIDENSKIPLVALTKDGNPKYPVTPFGKIRYGLDDEGIEILYEYPENYPFFGKNSLGDEIYPRDSKGLKYYPYTPEGGIMIATTSSDEKIYALDDYNKIIYPKTLDNLEFYIKDSDGYTYSILKKQELNFKNYIENTYPEQKTDEGVSEMLIMGYYTNSYPMDAFKNEYTNGTIIESLGYPVTCDNFIILPNVNNKPVVKRGDEYLIQYITKLLYRPYFESYDFLTSVKSNRKSKCDKPTTYKVLDIPVGIEKKTPSWYYYVIGIFIAIILFLFVLLFII